ncbi:putative membrane protein [Shigella boydii 4444-74]|uniref:Putative membrane protein n=1 Tax=Shigella boydii 4444-74 TaxID=766140 RepID=I6DP10_SHIBO|nr:putative membrane protein [Shigella boydii 4444-74]
MKKMMIATLAAASVLLAVANQAHAGATLDAVQKKGFVQCGISDGLLGFSYADADGKFSGIELMLMLMFVVVLPLLYLVTTRK